MWKVDFHQGRDDVPSCEDEKPPFMGSWRRIYLAVVLYTCFLVVVLYAMTVALQR